MRWHDRRLHRALVSGELEAIQNIIGAEEFGSILTVVDGEHSGSKAVVDKTGRIVAGALPESIVEDALSDAATLRANEQNRTVSYGATPVYIETISPPQDLLIFGAVHVGQALCEIAVLLDYRVTVVDSRAAFASEERFPQASRVLVGWPDDLEEEIAYDERTWVVVLSHDTRHETPVLTRALKEPVRFIGAMGSRRTHGLRVERLQEAGFSSEEVARIRGPVGLDIGAETPHEVAVSILAEMTMVRYGVGSGDALRGTEGPIHAPRDEKG